jgi:glycosyltransferase involved in cell wall biosynthesis
MSPSFKYVLMTAAYNEEAYIGKTIESVLSQTVLPRKWVIVSDGSTDRTDEIVADYARQHDWIHLLRVTKKPGHSFGAKVLALRQAIADLAHEEYAFIGNLDADLAIDSTYYEVLIQRFGDNPRLGITSGFVYEDQGKGFRSRWFNDTRNAPHAAQLVRRECLEAIGGYAVLKYGGEDWHAQISARMQGWEVESVPALKIYHFRHTGGGSGKLRNSFRLGRMDYAFGSNPLFVTFKSARRWSERPYVLGACTRLAGFWSGYLVREKREVSRELMTFLRREQRSRMLRVSHRQQPQPPAQEAGRELTRVS